MHCIGLDWIGYGTRGMVGGSARARTKCGARVSIRDMIGLDRIGYGVRGTVGALG